MTEVNDSPSISGKYDPTQIEHFWQKTWQEHNVFQSASSENAAQNQDLRSTYYILEMFPYPSGRLHMGHVRNYSIGDVLARAHRMAGYQVLYPLGWDAFGLPAENAAMKAQVHPKIWTKKNIEAMKQPLLRLGLSYDLTREISTCDPEYFVHEQRLFIEMFQKGLAYRKAALVNFCNHCATVLANEQVEDGKCWRCQSMVEQKNLVQWFFRITAYAEELLQSLSQLEGKWPDKVINMQRQWIGRSEGALFRFPLETPVDVTSKNEIEVFTTRPDTLFGVTFLSLAVEHPWALTLAKNTPNESKVKAFIDSVRSQDKIVRSAENTPKQGIFTGAYAIHPATGNKIPIYLANFVLMDYGTGAVMAVPAHDERDFAFAQQYGLPLKTVIIPSSTSFTEGQQAYTDQGVLQDSDLFSGLHSSDAKTKITMWAEQNGFGQKMVHFKLRDWLVSRQRYWGCPIPMVECLKGGHGYQPVPHSELPICLPEDVEFLPGGPSPLERHPTWKHTTCPICKGPAKRETDTMDGFVESSWYFLRYPSPHDPENMISEEGKRFLPVNQYIGGAEHATKHLIYARFFTKMLSDWGTLPAHFREPFTQLLNQGMVLKDAYRCVTHDYLYPEEVTKDGNCIHCGQKAEQLRMMKMSKSFRNVVEPMTLVEKYGADTVRVFCLFAAPPDSVMEWNDDAIEGAHRFLQRVYRLVQKSLILPKATSFHPELGKTLRRKTHQTIRKVTQDIFERKQFNTALASLMELSNEISDFLNKQNESSLALEEAISHIVLLLNPMAPHLSEELWKMMGHSDLLVLHPWPIADEEIAKEDELVVVVQVNGKRRAEIRVPIHASEDDIKQAALLSPNVKEHTHGKTIHKAIYIPGRLLNFVV